MKKRLLSIDIETYSSVDLGECGVYPYVEAPDFQILLFAYAFDDEPVQCIDLYHHPLPERLRVALTDPDIIKCAFNANFERTCLGKYLGTRMLPEQWRCTMVKALTLGLPGSLEKVALAMGLPEDKQKDKEGKALIRYFSIPCKPTKVNDGRKRNLPEHDPVKWEKFIRYCLQDVEVERGIRKALSRHRTLRVEHEYWALDQDINDRGIRLDMGLVSSSIEVDLEIKERASDELKRITGVENPNSRIQIKNWVENRIERKLEKFDKETLADLLKELPDGDVKRVVQLRQLTTKTSVAKYHKMKKCACADERARGLFQFYGASRTGRFSGKLLQLQNLSKNHITDLAEAREEIKEWDIDWLEMLYGDISNLLSQLVRTALIPSEGCRFIVSDFASVENVALAYLAGEQWVLDSYSAGGDLYCETATRMFGKKVEKHGQNSEYRKYGKITVLACGYGGSVGALKAFGADRLGINEAQMQKLVSDWRRANKKIVHFWYAIGDAAFKAIQDRRIIKMQYGLTLGMRGNALLIKLPSERCLYYQNARVEENRRFGKPGIVFDGIQQTTHKWGAIDTHGAKLVENITQAVCRDILCAAMQRLEKKGYPIVSTIHDEIVCDVPYGKGSVEEMNHIMTQPVSWAPGLTLRADGFEADFYQKD